MGIPGLRCNSLFISRLLFSTDRSGLSHGVYLCAEMHERLLVTISKKSPISNEQVIDKQTGVNGRREM